METTSTTILEDAQRLTKLAKEVEALAKGFKGRLQTEELAVEEGIQAWEALHNMPGTDHIQFHILEAVTSLEKRLPGDLIDELEEKLEKVSEQ